MQDRGCHLSDKTIKFRPKLTEPDPPPSRPPKCAQTDENISVKITFINGAEKQGINSQNVFCRIMRTESAFEVIQNEKHRTNTFKPEPQHKLNGPTNGEHKGTFLAFRVAAQPRRRPTLRSRIEQAEERTHTPPRNARKTYEIDSLCTSKGARWSTRQPEVPSSSSCKVSLSA